MNTITKTALNTPAVEKHYESLLTESLGHQKNLVKQRGSGLIMDLVGGVVGNVVKAVQAGRRLHKRRQTARSTSGATKKVAKRPQRAGKTIKRAPPRKNTSHTQRGNSRGRVYKRSQTTTVRKTSPSSQRGRGRKAAFGRKVVKRVGSKTVI